MGIIQLPIQVSGVRSKLKVGRGGARIIRNLDEKKNKVILINKRNTVMHDS